MWPIITALRPFSRRPFPRGLGAPWSHRAPTTPDGNKGAKRPATPADDRHPHRDVNEAGYGFSVMGNKILFRPIRFLDQQFRMFASAGGPEKTVPMGRSAWPSAADYDKVVASNPKALKNPRQRRYIEDLAYKRKFALWIRAHLILTGYGVRSPIPCNPAVLKPILDYFYSATGRPFCLRPGNKVFLPLLFLLLGRNAVIYLERWGSRGLCCFRSRLNDSSLKSRSGLILQPEAEFIFKHKARFPAGQVGAGLFRHIDAGF